MGILDCASRASVWKGYDYYQARKVVDFEEIEYNIFAATVEGSSGGPYTVELNIDHPRKSKCNCPHADGRKIVCKHMVAAYFTVFPLEADQFYEEAMAAEEEAMQQQEDMIDQTVAYILKMKKKDLQQALLQVLFEGPEWQFDRFVREHDIDII